MAALVRSSLLLLLAACLALAAADLVVPKVGVALPTAGTNDVIIGNCRSDDRLLMSQTVRKSSKWFKVRTEVVKYPTWGRNGGLISCIQLQALKTANIGSANVQSGGPGQSFVEVKVKSDRGHSVAWNVIIYGR
ncbi:putative salivary secreted peptide [Frankliniella fusca]|uniref:Salivary secreted peptide n=1 Tax=Frankliniella fusca TaxID=407009 RepID=A0AAE1I4N5_9NEOP|nr:putative salivary secreted peptide [Frankliniella fusca]